MRLWYTDQCSDDRTIFSYAWERFGIDDTDLSLDLILAGWDTFQNVSDLPVESVLNSYNDGITAT